VWGYVRATSESRWPPIQEWRRVPPRRLRTPENDRSTATRRTARLKGRTTDQVFPIGRHRCRASPAASSWDRGDFIPSTSSKPSLLSRILAHRSRNRRCNVRPFSFLYLSVLHSVSLHPFLSCLLHKSLTILPSLSLLRSMLTQRESIFFRFPLHGSGVLFRFPLSSMVRFVHQPYAQRFVSFRLVSSRLVHSRPCHVSFRLVAPFFFFLSLFSLSLPLYSHFFNVFCLLLRSHAWAHPSSTANRINQ